MTAAEEWPEEVVHPGSPAARAAVERARAGREERARTSLGSPTRSPETAETAETAGWSTVEEWPDVPELAAVPAAEIASRRDADRELVYARAVNDELLRLRSRARARELFAAETAPPEVPLDAGLLGDILARPARPRYRVAGLVLADGDTLVISQRKTGKTVFVLNLARSLITGTPFLDRFDVQPITGRVGLLNYEVSAAQVAEWADQIGIDHDRMFLVNLRGGRNPLTIADRRARLAGLLRSHDVESLIVDPFGRAYSGASQNDAAEVTAWLAMLDEFARTEVGARDLVLTAHAGWNGERTRGSSALEDWGDSFVTLTRGDEGDPARYLRAEGRGVDVEEDQLTIDPATRRLSLTGTGSRKAGRQDRAIEAAQRRIVEYLTEHPDGVTGRALAEGVTGGKDARFIATRDALVGAGKVLRTARQGRGGGALFTLPTRKVPNMPEGTQGAGSNLPNLPYKGEVGSSVGTNGEDTQPTETPDPPPADAPPPRPTKTCRICELPMTDLGDGADTHPTCGADS